MKIMERKIERKYRKTERKRGKRKRKRKKIEEHGQTENRETEIERKNSLVRMVQRVYFKMSAGKRTIIPPFFRSTKFLIFKMKMQF
jgi:hypothetical protein